MNTPSQAAIDAAEQFRIWKGRRGWDADSDSESFLQRTIQSAIDSALSEQATNDEQMIGGAEWDAAQKAEIEQLRKQLSEQAATAIDDAVRYDRRIQEQSATIEQQAKVIQGYSDDNMACAIRLKESAATIESQRQLLQQISTCHGFAGQEEIARAALAGKEANV